MNYYNTTTEPTPEPNSSLHFWALFVNVIGFFSITAVMTESVLRLIKYRDFGFTRKLDCDDEEEEKYTDKYTKEFEDLKERELDEVDFLNFNTRYMKEETPGGLVIMSYNKESDEDEPLKVKSKKIEDEKSLSVKEYILKSFMIKNSIKQNSSKAGYKLDELKSKVKEIQEDSNIPKRSKRKPRSDKNTISLDF